MAAPHRSRVSEQERRAKRIEKARDAFDEALDHLLNQPCPRCSERSLILADVTAGTGGLVIYCDRAFCRYKPPILLK